MTVNKLMANLRREQMAGNGNLEVFMFAHDHNPEDSEEGDGLVFSCDEYTDDLNRTFIGLHA